MRRLVHVLLKRVAPIPSRLLFDEGGFRGIGLGKHLGDEAVDFLLWNETRADAELLGVPKKCSPDWRHTVPRAGSEKSAAAESSSLKWSVS